MSYDKTTIVFNMNCLLNCLNNITSKTFNELVLEKAAINIRNWIKRNPNHKFPKSANGWQILLASQFDTLVVKVNPYMLLNTNVDLNKIHFQLEELKNKIFRFINKEKNRDLLNKKKLKNIVSSFSRFKYKINSMELFNKLVQLCIINKTTECINKRKRVEMVDTNVIDDDDHSIELEISTLNNVKKIKYNIAR